MYPLTVETDVTRSLILVYFKRIKHLRKVFIQPKPGDCDTKHFYSWLPAAVSIVNQGEFTPACKPKVYDARVHRDLEPMEEA